MIDELDELERFVRLDVDKKTAKKIVKQQKEKFRKRMISSTSWFWHEYKLHERIMLKTQMKIKGCIRWIKQSFN